MTVLLTIQCIFLLLYLLILIESFWSGKVPQIYFFYSAIIELCIIIPIFILNIIEGNMINSILWFVVIIVWIYNLNVHNKLRLKKK